MNPGLPIARCLAAMILAIVAWAAPSAAGAHEGPAHAGHHRAVAVLADASPVSVVPAETAVLMRSSVSASPISTASVESARVVLSGDSDGWSDRGLHGICCCGAACCAPGILAASVFLPGPAPENAVIRAYDTSARAGLGPEALTEPPRTLA